MLYFLSNHSSSILKYSPTSLWLITVMAVCSMSLAYNVVLVAIPNPKGVSFIEYTTTPLN